MKSSFVIFMHLSSGMQPRYANFGLPLIDHSHGLRTAPYYALSPLYMKNALFTCSPPHALQEADVEADVAVCKPIPDFPK